MDFCLLLKIWSKTLKIISKNLSGKYSQKPFDHAKQSGTEKRKKTKNIDDLILK